MSFRAAYKREMKRRFKVRFKTEVSLTGWQNSQWEKARNVVLEYNKDKPAKNRKPLPKRADFANLKKVKHARSN